MSNRLNAPRRKDFRPHLAKSKRVKRKQLRLRALRQESLARESRHLFSLEQLYRNGREPRPNSDDRGVSKNEYLADFYAGQRKRIVDLAERLPR